MKIFGEINIPCEYMSNNISQDWLKGRVVTEIMEEMLNKNLIKFTERYEGGYYIMEGEVNCD